MDQGGRFARRTLLAGSAAMAVPAFTGCGRPGSEPPDITRQQVQDIQDRYADRLFRALRSRNRDLLRTVETDPLLDRDLATIDLAARLGVARTAEEYTLPNSTGHLIRPSAGHDRQQLITVSDYSNTDRNWRDLALYVRNGPAATWLRAYGAGVHATDIPGLGPSLTALAPDAAGYQVSPSRIPGVVPKALADPSSDHAKLFADTEVRQRYAISLAGVRQQAAPVGTVTRAWRPGPLVIAIAIDDGYLALGTFDYDDTLTAHAGEHIAFAEKSSQHRAYPGRYRTTTATYGAMFAVLVPRHGKLRLISGEQRQTDLRVG